MLIPPFVVGEKKHCVVPNYPEKSSSVVIGQSSVIRDDKMTQVIHLLYQFHPHIFLSLLQKA